MPIGRVRMKHGCSLLHVILIILEISAATMCFESHAQENSENLSSLLAARMTGLRNGTSVSPGIASDRLRNADPDLLISQLQSFANDVSPRVRREVISIMLEAVSIHDTLDNRKIVTRYLYNGCRDDNGVLRQWSLKRIRNFAASDFSSDTIEMIRSRIGREAIPERREFLLLYGAAGIEEAVPYLESIIQDAPADVDREGSLYASLAWYAHLALARLGKSDSAQRCVQHVRDKNSIRGSVVILQKLAYTRHPIAIEYLNEVLLSEERMPPLHGVAGRRIARDAANALSQCFDGFPISVEPGDVSSFSDEELSACREWMADWKNKPILK